MRVEFALDAERRAGLGERFGLAIAEQFDMTWRMWDAAERKRVVVMVSKYDHCLLDLLWRWRRGELEAGIVMVVSNHPDLRAERVVLAHAVQWHCQDRIIRHGNTTVVFLDVRP